MKKNDPSCALHARFAALNLRGGKTALSPAQKQILRGMAQRLKPALCIGKEGAGENIEKELNKALEACGLVKVRFAEGREALKAQCAQLERATQSQCVGGVGRVASFFRLPSAPVKSDFDF